MKATNDEIQAYILGKFSGSGSQLMKAVRSPPLRDQIPFSQVTFGEFDFFLIVRAPDIKSLQTLVFTSLLGRDDVSDTLTLLPLEFSTDPLEDKLEGKELGLVLGKVRTPNLAKVMKCLREVEESEEILRSEDILGPYDFLVFVELKKGLRDLGEFITKRIRSIDGIEYTMTLLCYS